MWLYDVGAKTVAWWRGGVVRAFLAPLLALRSRVGNQKRLGNRVSCWRYPNTSTNIAATRITSSFAADSNYRGHPLEVLEKRRGRSKRISHSRDRLLSL